MPTNNTVVWGSSVYHFPAGSNERGFKPEMDSKGRPTGRLVDTGNWSKRRNKRYEAIHRGFISVTD